jgi:peroxiredoxin
MIRFSRLALCLSLILVLPALASSRQGMLRMGSIAPDFTAPASLDGENFTFSLKQAMAKGAVVVYFFPSAFTQGCDLEAHTFATQMDKFKAAGASVIGVSADSIERLDAFSKDPAYCAGHFPVASDPSGKIAASYGLKSTPAHAGMKDVRGATIDHAFIPRTTFVIDAKGKVIASMSSAEDGLTPVDHVEKSLVIVEKLGRNDSGR